MKPALQLRISQQLAMTPQLQQAIRLLQMPVAELNTQLEQLLAENMMLELEEPPPEPRKPRWKQAPRRIRQKGHPGRRNAC